MSFPADVEVIQRALERFFRMHAGRRLAAGRDPRFEVLPSMPGWSVLRRLSAGPLHMGQIAALALMDPGAAARQVGRLERRGWVRRGPSPVDGRGTIVSLTPAGEAICAETVAMLNRHLERVLMAWDPADREEFAELLDRFVRDNAEVQFRPEDGSAGGPGQAGPARAQVEPGQAGAGSAAAAPPT